jgi:16S rRNA (uracil1498-N3)-methyltransferase
LTLVVPGCKGARLDWLIEKATELGVSRFILAEFERTVVHTRPQHGRKLERTAIAACKQCHRAWLPQIQSGVALGQAVQAVADAALLVAHLSGDAPPLAKWLAAHHSTTANLAVVIGPEGGLAPAELDALMAAGGQLVCLAEHTLRVETAALAVAACWAAEMIAP